MHKNNALEIQALWIMESLSKGSAGPRAARHYSHVNHANVKSKGHRGNRTETTQQAPVRLQDDVRLKRRHTGSYPTFDI